MTSRKIFYAGFTKGLLDISHSPYFRRDVASIFVDEESARLYFVDVRPVRIEEEKPERPRLTIVKKKKPSPDK
jgi:hypothetical protein